MPLSAGSRLGPYEIVSLLGAGGMGEVYRAQDTRLERTVAIKVLAGSLAADPDLRARFEREARAISQLTHPNICTLYDVGSQDGVEFLVMEYLEGETLADRLAGTKRAGATTPGDASMRSVAPASGAARPLKLEDALAISLQMADALDKAHRRGIIHRDLKPGNVMLVRGGGSAAIPTAKLLDFGLAKLGAAPPQSITETRLATTPPRSAEAPLTSRGTILGTFQYMAPEQIEGQEADARTDIWAFGCVLYEMLTGRRAFEGKTQTSLIWRDPRATADAGRRAPATHAARAQPHRPHVPCEGSRRPVSDGARSLAAAAMD
jgi:serine/threonine protein kinase